MKNNEPEVCVIADELLPVGLPEKLVGKKFEHICNQIDYDKCDWAGYNQIYVQAELVWDGTECTKFNGIKLLQKLRLKDINLPVIVCSFVPLEILIKTYKFDILRFKGHGFIQLPNNETIHSNDEQPLDSMEMLDLTSHYCDLSGAITAIYHRKQQAGSDPKVAKPFLIKMLNEICGLDGLPSALMTLLDDDLATVSSIKDEDKKALDNYLDLKVTRLTSLLPSEDSNERKNGIKYEGHWEVLILDDELESDQIVSLIKTLQDNCVIKVHTATNVEKAQKIIQEDVFNRITVVISDYRLEEEGEIKGLQGYSFVQWLAREPRFNSIFVLSGLDSDFIEDIFKSYDIKVSSNNKNKYFDDGLEGYVNDIIKAGNNEYNCILNLPTAGVWDPHLKTFYAHYRMRPDHDNIERTISLRARRIVNELESFFSIESKKDNNWFYKLLTEVKVMSPANSITTRLYDEKTNKTKKIDISTWKQFIEVMVYRRVAIYLVKIKGQHVPIVSGLIHTGKFEPTKTKIFTSLALSETDISDRILVEELNWFKVFLDINSERKNMAEREHIVFFKNLINKLELFLNKSERFDKVREKISALEQDEEDILVNKLPACALISIINPSNFSTEIAEGPKKKECIKLYCNTLTEIQQIIEIIKSWKIDIMVVDEFCKNIEAKIIELEQIGIFKKAI